MDDVTFEAYLVQKKIDKTKFMTESSTLFSEWKILFEQVHPESFATQKKFQINAIRRKFLLQPTT
jgi:hypothetical protein